MIILSNIIGAMFFNFEAHLADVGTLNLPFLLVVKNTLPSAVNFLPSFDPTNSILSGMIPDVSLLSYATQVTSTEEYSIQFLFLGNGSHIPKDAENIKHQQHRKMLELFKIYHTNFTDLIVMV